MAWRDMDVVNKYLRHPMGIGLCDLIMIEKLCGTIAPAQRLGSPSLSSKVSDGKCSREKIIPISPIIDQSIDTHPFIDVDHEITITQDDDTRAEFCNYSTRNSERENIVAHDISFDDKENCQLSCTFSTDKNKVTQMERRVDVDVSYLSSPDCDMTGPDTVKDQTCVVDHLTRLTGGLMLTTKHVQMEVESRGNSVESTSCFGNWFDQYITANNEFKCVISYSNPQLRDDILPDVLNDSACRMRLSSSHRRCAGASGRAINSISALLPLTTSAGSGREKYRGGTLVVTSKKETSAWETAIRNISFAKYHRYTDTLAKRRKFGAYRVASFDFVLTTFDVLRAREVVLPMPGTSESSDDEEVNDVDPNAGGNTDKAPWMQRRKAGNGEVKTLTDGMSNLHLVLWERIIIDHSCVSGIRCGTVRGEAVGELRSRSTLSIVEVAEDFPPTTVLRDIANLLDIKSGNLENAHCQLWN